MKKKKKKFAIGKDLIFTLLYMVLCSAILPVFNFTTAQIGIVFLVMAIFEFGISFFSKKEVKK